MNFLKQLDEDKNINDETCCWHEFGIFSVFVLASILIFKSSSYWWNTRFKVGGMTRIKLPGYHAIVLNYQHRRLTKYECHCLHFF